MVLMWNLGSGARGVAHVFAVMMRVGLGTEIPGPPSPSFTATRFQELLALFEACRNHSAAFCVAVTIILCSQPIMAPVHEEEAVDITALLKSILDNYPAGSATLREILQNSDDAGSRIQVRFQS